MNPQWIEACASDAIEPEDVVRFDYAGHSFAIYRTADGAYYATDGLCTHGQAHLADGLVIGDLIECPKHNGRFDLRTGQPKRAPACAGLRTYPVRVERARVWIQVP